MNLAHESSDEDQEEDNKGDVAGARRQSHEEGFQNQAGQDMATHDPARGSKAHTGEPSTDCSSAQNWQQVSDNKDSNTSY